MVGGDGKGVEFEFGVNDRMEICVCQNLRNIFFMCAASIGLCEFAQSTPLFRSMPPTTTTTTKTGGGVEVMMISIVLGFGFTSTTGWMIVNEDLLINVIIIIIVHCACTRLCMRGGQMMMMTIVLHTVTIFIGELRRTANNFGKRVRFSY